MIPELLETGSSWDYRNSRVFTIKVVEIKNCLDNNETVVTARLLANRVDHNPHAGLTSIDGSRRNTFLTFTSCFFVCARVDISTCIQTRKCVFTGCWVTVSCLRLCPRTSRATMALPRNYRDTSFLLPGPGSRLALSPPPRQPIHLRFLMIRWKTIFSLRN